MRQIIRTNQTILNPNNPNNAKNTADFIVRFTGLKFDVVGAQLGILVSPVLPSIGNEWMCQ